MLEFPLPAAPETDDYMRVQREPWISILDVIYGHIWWFLVLWTRVHRLVKTPWFAKPCQGVSPLIGFLDFLCQKHLEQTIICEFKESHELYFGCHVWSYLVDFSAMDESTQARQNALVCQAISDSILEFPLSETPETDNYMQVQREAWISILDII